MDSFKTLSFGKKLVNVAFSGLVFSIILLINSAGSYRNKLEAFGKNLLQWEVETKAGAPRTDGLQYRWLRELLDIVEHVQKPEEFLENTKLELFQDQVFCFSPKGDLIALPRGASPVDFAQLMSAACVIPDLIRNPLINEGMLK